MADSSASNERTPAPGRTPSPPSNIPASHHDDPLRVEGLTEGLAEAGSRFREACDGVRGIAPGTENADLREAAEATRRLWSEVPDAPLIATGHQATFRHPGILAKDLLAAALAKELGGGVLRLVVDQDVHPVGPLQVPQLAPHAGLHVRSMACREPSLQAPTGRRPPIRLDRERGPASSFEAVERGVDAIDSALRREAGAASAARQVAAAFDALAVPCSLLAAPRFATELLATPIGLRLLAAIAEHPRRCAAAFNDALALDPRAARPLAIESNRIEMPLWRIADDRPRERVHLDPGETARRRLDRLREAALASPSRLAPRGLLMTGLARLVADLFIHGRGGWRYDRVTERWFASWLGATLGPMAMVSADLRLPLGVGPATTDPRRRWHDPDADPDESMGTSPSLAKRASLRAIDSAPRGSSARREAFHAMHRRLDEVRRARGIEALPVHGVDPATIAARRDWAFPLHGAGAITDLAARCRRLAEEVVAGSTFSRPFRPDEADPGDRPASRGTRSDR